MPVNLSAPVASDLLSIAGLRIGVAEAGVRKAGRKDLTVMLIDEGASVGGVFTQNRFCAAPVQLCREHLARGLPVRAIVINTGNANAGTGEDGLARARATCIALAQMLEVAPEQVLPFSTGVIMEPLPTDRIIAGLPDALADAKADHWLRAAEGIMTTDTVPKAFSARIALDGGQTVAVTGISKGAGMIRPNMATMLGFMATDAKLAPTLAHALALRLAEASFNRVTVDGDTSTNDSFIVVATGKGGPAIDSLDSPAGRALVAGMTEVARKLAQAIVRDGEGATKFIEVRVEGGANAEECRKVAYSIAHSPLVKTAFFASDPNLGRILAAFGYAGIADLDPAGIELHLDDVHVATQGGRNPAYREEDGQRVMKKSEIVVRVSLGRGDAQDSVWTCDFSHDYVSINADYRS